jgi:P-type conjugative transfer protein TrbG
VQEAVRRHVASGKWQTYRTPAYVLYPFGEGPEPVVDCAALRTTDLQLQAGETVTDLAVGDQERWTATPASSGDPRDPVPHIALKPQADGIATNLTVYTTRHIYHLLLRSGQRAMQEVEFYYPDELLHAMRDADAGAAQAKRATTLNPAASAGVNAVQVAAVDPSQLNFAYTISGPNVPFKPLRAFDDGAHVYIQMARGMSTSTAPALLIGAAGGTQMVNYRLVGGDYFVVDHLFDEALLVSGVGPEQDRVTITYAGGGR